MEVDGIRIPNRACGLSTTSPPFLLRPLYVFRLDTTSAFGHLGMLEMTLISGLAQLNDTANPPAY